MLPQKNNVSKHIIQTDEDVFKELFRRFFPKLYLFSYDFVKDRDIAREITHDSFLKYWENRNNLKPDSNAEAYLTTVCRNKCLNYLKHEKVILKFKEVILEEQIEKGMFSKILTDYSFESVDFEKLLVTIKHSIQNLPDQCRTVFELSRFKKKKYSDIASLLNISPKTVEAHISLALKRLRQDLKDFL